MRNRRGSRREEYGRNKTPKSDYRPWNAAILKQPESNISDSNGNSREIKETPEGGVTAAAVLVSDVPPSYSTWRYANLVGLGIVEPKKPFEKHWTYSEAQKSMHENVREDDEVMNDTSQEPSELEPRYGNQYKPPANRQAASRLDAPRQDAPRQDAPRQDAPRQDALGQDVPQQYRDDNIKRNAKETSANPKIAEVSFRLVGSGFRRAEALIVDIHSFNSPNTSSSYYSNSSSSSPISVNSPTSPDDPLLSPLLELNEALTSQAKTVKTQDSSQGRKSTRASSDKGWKENWAQGYGNIW